MATKQIKFLKPYQYFVAGSIQSLPAPIADLLVKRGIAEDVKEVQMPATTRKPKESKNVLRIEGK